MRNTRFLLCTIAAVALFCTGTQSRGPEAADASPEQKVLDRELGNWLHTCTNLKAEWTPNQTQTTVTASYARILGGRFVQGKGKVSDGHTFLQLDTYDAQRKCYHRWFFYSNGQTSEHIGKYNADAKSMTWSSSMAGNLTSTQIDRYIDANTMEFSILVTDRDGKVYSHTEGKSVRTE